MCVFAKGLTEKKDNNVFFTEIMDCIIFLMNTCNTHLLVFVVLVHVHDGFHQVIYKKLKVEA